MIHRKARSLMSTGEAMARVAATALSQTAAQQTRPSGSISVPNADGTRTVIGALNTTGSTMATHVGDTTPPGIPTGITAWSGDGKVHVAWDGTLSGGIPTDFDHVTIRIDGKPVASLTRAGSVTYDVAAGWTNLWPNSSIVSTNTRTDGAYNWGRAPSGYIPVNVGDTLTISCYINGTNVTKPDKGYAYLYAYYASKARVGTTDAPDALSLPINQGPHYVVPSGVAYVQAFIGIGPGTSGSVFRGKLERGTTATPWTPSPLDPVDGYVASVTATAEDDTCLADGTAAHNVSAACTAISVVVTDVAKDAATMTITSTHGLVFKSDRISTTLQVSVFQPGGNRITDQTALVAAFGAMAHIVWQWQRDGSDVWGTILSSDSRVSDGGFSLAVSSADVDARTSFLAQLII